MPRRHLTLQSARAHLDGERLWTCHRYLVNRMYFCWAIVNDRRECICWVILHSNVKRYSTFPWKLMFSPFSQQRRAKQGLARSNVRNYQNSRESYWRRQGIHKWWISFELHRFLSKIGRNRFFQLHIYFRGCWPFEINAEIQPSSVNQNWRCTESPFPLISLTLRQRDKCNKMNFSKNR